MEKSTSVPISTIAPRHVNAVLRRYEEAYSMTEALASSAQVLRWGAKIVLIGGATAMIGLGLNGAGWFSTVSPMILGFLLYLSFRASGLLVAAAGQFLTAALDSAVHTSPFLDCEQRAKVMLL